MDVKDDILFDSSESTKNITCLQKNWNKII